MIEDLDSPKARYANFIDTWGVQFDLPAWEDMERHPLRRLLELEASHPRAAARRRTNVVGFVDNAVFYDFARALAFVEATASTAPIFEFSVSISGNLHGRRNEPHLMLTVLLMEPAS